MIRYWRRVDDECAAQSKGALLFIHSLSKNKKENPRHLLTQTIHPATRIARNVTRDSGTTGKTAGESVAALFELSISLIQSISFSAECLLNSHFAVINSLILLQSL